MNSVHSLRGLVHCRPFETMIRHPRRSYIIWFVLIPLHKPTLFLFETFHSDVDRRTRWIYVFKVLIGVFTSNCIKLKQIPLSYKIPLKVYFYFYKILTCRPPSKKFNVLITKNAVELLACCIRQWDFDVNESMT